MATSCYPPDSVPKLTAHLLFSLENSTNNADAATNKFVFGQNMSERVLVSGSCGDFFLGPRRPLAPPFPVRGAWCGCHVVSYKVRTLPLASKSQHGRSLTSGFLKIRVPLLVSSHPETGFHSITGHTSSWLSRPGRGVSIPQQLVHQDPQTIPSLYAFVSLQSPPKLNEVTSDVNRENSAAESGSESSSQEATPEKGTLQSYYHMGGDTTGQEHCPRPCLGGMWGPAQHGSNNLMSQPLGQSQKALDALVFSEQKGGVFI